MKILNKIIKLANDNLFFLFTILFIFFFLQKFLFLGLLPIPSDTIVGLYHPFLDLYAKISPSGVPFQNFLITDPVRQIIPWKTLVIDNLSVFNLPLWNPYEMAGKPLLANFQSSVFYPLNILLFVKPFYFSWSIFVIIQPILLCIFMYFYLKNLKVDKRAIALSSVAFAFGGFCISWFEWGNIVHTALWLPLILLAIDKTVSSIKYQVLSIKNVWGWVFLLALIFSFFAGHLQIFFYVFLVSFAYLLMRLLEVKKKSSIVKLFTIHYLLFTALTAIQWIPTLQFINISARSVDQSPLASDGWFIPIQHLVQFVAPDFFGNPATLNYWGVWNYAEFVGYIGIMGLFFALCSILSSKKKETFFFISIILISLIFALPDPISKLPFTLQIPFLSTAQPTRLIFLVSFSLSMLSAFGFDYLINSKKVNVKIILSIIVSASILFVLLWLIVMGKIDLKITAENLLIAKRNLIFPSIVFGIGMVLVLGVIFIKDSMTKTFFIFLILILSFYDMYRFGTKFTPFTQTSYFYPPTKSIDFIKKDKTVFRIASTDSRIMPPNFATFYKIQSIEGYDPLYIRRYAELIAAAARNKPDISTPFGFNRIITFQNYESVIYDLLGVKYVLTLDDQKPGKLDKVFSEENTRVYQNKNVFNRAFFVTKTYILDNKQNAIEKILDPKTSLSHEATVEEVSDKSKFLSSWNSGIANITKYSDNRVEINTENGGPGFLILTDVYYPTWKAQIDGREASIYLADYTFRGLIVPGGSHKIVFYNTL